MDRGNAFSCMKYTLIICNVFFFILAIFNALFGLGYKEQKWPGGYTGGQMAIFSLFVMAFTTIGYCGAHLHKGYLLVTYGSVFLVFTIGNIVIWVIYNDKSVVGSMPQGYIILFGIIDIFLMLFAFTLAYKLRRIPSNTQSSGGSTVLHRGDSDHIQTRSPNFANIHPCPVPGCTYGKVITS